MYPRFSIKNKTVILNGINVIYKNEANTICNLCKSAIEDMYHFMCICPNYNLMIRF